MIYPFNVIMPIGRYAGEPLSVIPSEHLFQMWSLGVFESTVIYKGHKVDMSLINKWCEDNQAALIADAWDRDLDYIS